MPRAIVGEMPGCYTLRETVEKTAYGMGGAGMILVPQIARIAVVGLVGLTAPAFAGGLMPGNGGSILLPLTLPPSSQNSVSLTDPHSGFDILGQKFGVRDGRLDFFSVRPSDNDDFKPLLRGGVGGGGLQLQLKW
jgi:hypothetical protein